MRIPPVIDNLFREHETKTNILESQAQVSQKTADLPEASSDHLFLNNIRPEQAREFLLNHIQRKLAYNAPNLSKSLQEYTAELGSANDVSKTINAKISNILNTENPSVNNLSDNIKNGFSEAQQVLNTIGIMDMGFQSEFEAIQRDVTDFITKNVKSQVNS